MSNYTLKVGNKTLVNFMVGNTMVMRLYKGSKLLWERIVDYSKARTLDELAAVKWSDVGIVDGHSVMVSGPLTKEVVNENLESFESARVEHICSGVDTKFDAPPFFRNCVTFEANVPELKDGYRLFEQADGLVSFNSSLPSLVNGENMFAACNGMETWTTDLSSLVDGQGMFTMCTLLNKPTTKLPNLENGDRMFNYCSKNLTEWDIDMPKLKSANYMFQNCQNLENFEANVGSLEDACKMFEFCGKINFVYPKTLQASIPLEKIVVSLPTGSWGTHTFKFDAEGSQTIVDLGEMSYAKGWTPVSTITDGTGKFEGGYEITDWVVQLPNLQTGAYMFKSTPYNGWNIDLPSLQEANCMFAYSGIGSFTGNIHSLWNADSMFYSCTNLESFNEPLCSLTHAYNMFANSGLKTFNAPISGLTDSGRMFYECDKLTSFTSSILSSLEKGSEMFKSCSKLESFTASGTLVNLNNGTEMFQDCSSLTSFTEDMPSLVTGDGMFCNCSSLTTYQGNLNSLVYGNSMFANGPLSVFRENLPNLKQAHAMFSNTNLQTFTSSLDQLVDGSDMFSNTKLPEWRIPLPSIENADWMFQFITPLEKFVSDMRSCTSATSMFVGCNSLNMVEPRNLEDETALVELVTSLPSHVGSPNTYQYQYVYTDDRGSQHMLDGSAMQNSSAILKSKGWKAVSDIRDGSGQYNCYNDGADEVYNYNGGFSLVNWTVDMPELNAARQMFQCCPALQTFEADISEMTDGTNMFARCASLTSFTGNTASLRNAYAMFLGCTNLTSVDIDVSALQDGGEMFNYCHSLTSWDMEFPSLTVGNAMFGHNLSLRSFSSSVPHLQSANSMFIGDVNLTSINCEFPRVSNMEQMFKGCTGLVNYSAEFPEGKTAYAMFDGCTNLQTVELKMPKLSEGYTSGAWSGRMFDDMIYGKTSKCAALVSVALVGVTPSLGISDVIGSLPSYGENPDGSHVIMFQTEGGCASVMDDLKTQATSKGWLWMPSGEDISGAYQGNGSLTSFSGNLPQARVARNAFANCQNLQSFTGSMPNLQNATSMFEGCTSLQSMTGNMQSVTTAEDMFKGCTSLEEVDNSVFGSLRNADGMFENCTSFTGVFSEEMSCIGITSASRMFKGSGIGAFITAVPNLVTATSMFQGAQSFSRFETGPLEALTTANDMFNGSSLWEFTVDMPNVSNVNGMFINCQMLTKFVSSIPNAKFYNYTNMFNGCSNLTYVEPRGLTNISYVNFLINSLPQYTSVDGSHRIVLDVATSANILSAINTANQRGWNTTFTITTADTFFKNNTTLTTWNSELPNLTRAKEMFQGCANLTSVNVGSLDELTCGRSMFYGCTNLTSLDADYPNVVIGDGMFYDCKKYTRAIDFDMTSLTSGRWMFSKSGITKFNSDCPNLDDGDYMFYVCPNLTEIVSDFSNVQMIIKESRTYFVEGCTALEVFDADLSSIEYGAYMFQGLTNLRTYRGNLGKLQQGYQMYKNCTSLSSWDGDLSSLTNGYEMFSGCKLDIASVQKIAQTIKDVNGPPNNGGTAALVYKTIHIDYAGGMTQAHTDAFNTIKGKGWTVIANGTTI